MKAAKPPNGSRTHPGEGRMVAPWPSFFRPIAPVRQIGPARGKSCHPTIFSQHRSSVFFAASRVLIVSMYCKIS
jgi:hypothetical protein